MQDLSVLAGKLVKALIFLNAGLKKTIAWMARMALTLVIEAVPAMTAWASSAWAAAPATWASVAPFVALAAAILGVVAAIATLAKHWEELDFLEGLKGMCQVITGGIGKGKASKKTAERHVGSGVKIVSVCIGAM